MTALAVPVPPSDVMRIRDRLVASTPLTFDEVTKLMVATCQDVCHAVAGSGGEAFIVPLEPETSIPGWTNPSEITEEIARTATDADNEITVTPTQPVDETGMQRLLDLVRERSDEASLAVVTPVTPLIQRRHVDAAAMRLRTSDVVVGPTSRCGWYFFGVSRETDLTLGPDACALPTITRDVLEAEVSIASIPFLPRMETNEELSTILGLVDLATITDPARAPFTRSWAERTGIQIGVEDGGVQITRTDARRHE